MTIAPVLSRIRFIVGISLLVLSIASCTPGTKYTLFNNTDGDIVVTIDRQTYSIPKGGLGPLENWHAGSVTIETKNQAWSYSVHLPAFHELAVDGSYNEKAFGFSQTELSARRITVQVNSDGRIFIVPPGDATPVPTNAVQLDGFPLSPTISATRPTPAVERDWPISGFSTARGKLDVQCSDHILWSASPSLLRWAAKENDGRIEIVKKEFMREWVFFISASA